MTDQSYAVGVLISFATGSVALALDHMRVRVNRAEGHAVRANERVGRLALRVDDLESALLDLDEELAASGACD